jgi:hypothetical protein
MVVLNKRLAGLFLFLATARLKFISAQTNFNSLFTDFSCFLASPAIILGRERMLLTEFFSFSGNSFEPSKMFLTAFIFKGSSREIFFADFLNQLLIRVGNFFFIIFLVFLSFNLKTCSLLKFIKWQIAISFKLKKYYILIL